MKKVFGWIAGVALTASISYGQYTGPWTHTWDFDSGTQGWSLNGGAWWFDSGGVGGSGGIVVSDASWAEILAPTTLNGNQTPFVLQVDVFIPTTGYFQDIGIGAYREDGKGPQVHGGSASNLGIASVDRSWDNSTQQKSWVFEDTTARGVWNTLQIDYGVTTPGKYSTWILLNGSGWWGTGPLWYNIQQDREVNPDPLPAGFGKLRIGAVSEPRYGGPWGTTTFDNVKLFVVPEPASIGLLAIGGLLLTRRRRMA